MREIREIVSAESQNIPFAELKEYIQTKIKESTCKAVGQ